MKKNRKLDYFLKFLSIVYLVALIYFLFFSERYNRQPGEEYKYNLEPFKEISRYFNYIDSFTIELFLVNIVGNIVGFMPLGIIMPLWFKKAKNFFVSTFFVALFSLTVELAQLITKTGSFDVDDIILNTFGGILGFIIYVVFINRRINIKNKK